jgi:hypothetical protein
MVAVLEVLQEELKGLNTETRRLEETIPANMAGLLE